MQFYVDFDSSLFLRSVDSLPHSALGIVKFVRHITILIEKTGHRKPAILRSLSGEAPKQ